TLMAVCAARRGEHITVVVGDVLAAVRHASWLSTLGVTAAPIVGASTQLGHINRLHQVHAAAPGPGSQLAGFGSEHDLFSTACALDALRSSTTPWEFRDAPCRGKLTTPKSGSDQAAQHTYGCPLWNRCQRHRNSRELVDAQAWVTTTAGLVHSRVPAELNRDQLRYLELVWRRSDLVIVDEADQVQTQLDAMFSPGQTLFGHDQEAWLEQLAEHT